LEAELLIVVWADPFAGVDRALLQCRIDVAARKLLRHDPEPGEDRAGKAADPELEALEVVDRLELLAEPATHLRSGVARGETDAVVVLEEIVEQLIAAAEAQPRVHLPAVETERQRGAEGHRRVFAPVVVHRRVAHLDRAALDGVEHLQARDDLAGGEGLDLEAVVGDLRHALAAVLASAIE